MDQSSQPVLSPAFAVIFVLRRRGEPSNKVFDTKYEPYWQHELTRIFNREKYEPREKGAERFTEENEGNGVGRHPALKI
jgi:hypothetical protein